MRLSTGVVTYEAVITNTNLDPEDNVGEYREGGNRFQELLEAPFPRAAREFAEGTIDQTREAYERYTRTLDVVVQILGNSFAAAAALRRTIVDTAHGHLNLSFDLAKSLTAANNLSEIVQLQAAYWRKQFNKATTQAEEVRRRVIGVGLTAEAPSPERVRDPVNKASPWAEEAPKTRHSCTARVPIAEAQRGDTPKIEAPRAARPTARQPDERRSKTRKKNAPQEEAHQRNLPAEIKFGVLDGNAVRFTSLEAWWLVNGVWRPISPDEVLLNAAVMREARFNQFFPEVPRLPSNAFSPQDEAD